MSEPQSTRDSGDPPAPPGNRESIINHPQYRFNPNFKPGEEVDRFLHRIYSDLEEEHGPLSRNRLERVIRSNLCNSTHLSEKDWERVFGDKSDLSERSSRLSFEEFTHIVFELRDLNVEVVRDAYNSWIQFKFDSDFEEGVLAPIQEDPESDGISRLETVFRSLVAGGLAGAVAKSAIAPFDRVKILFQVSKSKFSFRSALTTGRDIVIHDGLRALWRGNVATMLRILPYAGIQHSSYDQFKHMFMDYNELTQGTRELSAHERVLAGSLAGALSVSCTYPLDILRARLAVSSGSRPIRLWASASDMCRREGVRTLFRGMGPTLLGVLPYGGIAFSLNESLKWEATRLQNPHSQMSDADAEMRQLPPLTKLACGAVAGLVAQSVTYPLDVVRRRMQTAGYVCRGVDHAAVADKGTYAGMLVTARHVVATEGPMALFKGLSMNWVKGPIAVGISLTAYDVFKEMLDVGLTE